MERLNPAAGQGPLPSSCGHFCPRGERQLHQPRTTRMPFLAGIVFVVTGLAFMLFGLFLFYAFLPLLFAFIGFDIGVLFGRWLTGSIGLIAIVLGMVAAGILAVASYSLVHDWRTTWARPAVSWWDFHLLLASVWRGGSWASSISF